MQKVVQVRRDAVARLRQPLLQLVDERGQSFNPTLPAAPLSVCKHRPSSSMRLARVVPAVEADYNPLDPLEQLAGIREERLPHLIVEVDSHGQRGDRDIDRRSPGGASRSGSVDRSNTRETPSRSRRHGAARQGFRAVGADFPPGRNPSGDRAGPGPRAAEDRPGRSRIPRSGPAHRRAMGRHSSDRAGSR